MLMLQISAGQGPAECELAVAHALRRLQQEALEYAVCPEILESHRGQVGDGLKSVLLSLSGAQAETLAQRWQGSLQWICASPLRPRHPRKNWFIAAQSYRITEPAAEQDIRFSFCRASGAGGQHVNKTSSAVQATHIATGIQVKVQSERSQHANKKRARLLIAYRLAEQQQQRQAQAGKQRWKQHYELERGSPVRVFRGIRFTEVS